MARQSNADYWARRFKNMEDALKDRGYAYVENMERQFALAQAEVEKQIAAWYQRVAANNEITLADAKRLLTARELAEFRWTVGEYIAYGQQNALDGAWVKQLENVSARVHISRLEALKLQIQQQAEVLYANQLDAVDAAARELYLGSYYHTAFEVQRGLGVGCTMQAIHESAITKVLSRPWTADGQTFRDRCWTDKQSLVNAVNTKLTQMIIRGDPPDQVIKTIAHQFNVSKGKAGRLVMTESAYFSSAAQKDCFHDLGVERYKVVASFDGDACELCGAMDGKVFQMSDYQVGLTAPPFHPWCRCCTAPYFEDMEKLGERWTRNPDGTTSKVPADMSFEEWKKQFIPAGKTDWQSGLPTAILTSRNLSKAERTYKAVRTTATDVTTEYIQGATPGQGSIVYDEGYDPGKHKDEIVMAEWLYKTFGGDITLLTESTKEGEKRADYLWNGKLWDLKSVTTEKAANTAIKRGLAQIKLNPGGIILDYGETDISMECLQSVIDKRMQWLAEGSGADIMIVKNGVVIKILRYKK